jgi:hypothetical protein
MARAPIAVDITGIPELARLVDEVQRTRTPRVLRRDNTDAAILVPLERSRPRGRQSRLVDTTMLAPLRQVALEDLAGIAGSLQTPRPWDDVLEMAREDALLDRHRPGR